MAGAGGVEGLPHGSSLSPSLRALLNHEFKSVGDLDNASALLERLSAHLHTSQDRLSHLHSSITTALAAWASHSRSTSSSLSLLTQKIQEFPTAASLSSSAFDSSAQQDFVGKLPLLAAEVARVERIRLYAETALRLEALVGDVEDAVASIVVTPRVPLPRKLANSPASDILVDLSGKFSVATIALWKVEDIIVATAASWPQWKRLIMAADLRVDSAFVSLRPSAFADYRSKLEAIGWPPPLSAGAQDGEQRDTKLDNPLLSLHGEAKRKFEDSFVSLSTLQALQCQRKARQAKDDSSKSFAAVAGRANEHDLLWTIEELVAPIKSRAAYHFSKWSDKPELIFGLAYRVAQQNLQIVDIVLQPMLDRVKLPGYCVSEEWISALVAMVTHHLRSHILTKLAEKHILEDENTQEASSLWLHIVDLAISFDKKMQSLALKAVIPSLSKVELDTLDESVREGHSVLKCVSVFAERREWLELWADLELADAKEKLSNELQKESAWLVNTQSGFVGGSSAVRFEDAPDSFRHPQSAEVTMLKFWALLNRCRCLPERHWQLTFINHVRAPYMDAFLAKMLQKCQEAEALTALAEESAVLMVVSCINAACFCEHKLKEWSDDLFFLDLRGVQIQSETMDGLAWAETEKNLSPVEGGVFDTEISLLKQFRTEWLHKLVSATHRAFDASCQDYQRNKKRWQEENRVSNGSPEDISISPGLVDSLAILQSRLSMFKDLLGEGVFVDLWRSVASSLDQLLMNAVVLGGARFSSFGSLQLAKDIGALFQIFKPFCVRPASFFPNLHDTALLLVLSREDVQQLQKTLTPSSAWRFQDKGDETRLASLKYDGVRSLSPGTAGRILAQRFFAKV